MQSNIDKDRNLTFHVIVILIVSFILKLILLLRFSNIPFVNDELFYKTLAEGLSSGNGVGIQKDVLWNGLLWPPGYISFLAAHISLFNNWVVAAKLSQIVLSTLSAYVIYLIGKKYFSEKTGAIACAIVSFNPTLIAFTHYFWNETLYIFLFYLFIYCILRTTEEESIRWPIISGIMLAATAYIKPLSLYFYPVIMLWMYFSAGLRKKKQMRNICLPLITALLLISPWTIRNYIVYDRFCLVDANLGVNLISGNTPGGPANYDYNMWRSYKTYENPDMSMNVIDRDKERTAIALKCIADAPLDFLKKIPTKICDLFSPTSFLVRHIKLKLYGNPESSIAKITIWTDVLSYMAIVLLGIAGLVIGTERANSSHIRILFLCLFFYTITIHTITFGMSRFRLGLMPFVMLYAADALCTGIPALTKIKRTALLFASISVIIFIIMWMKRIGSVFL
ncbi:MAG: glycosyltransferase family 39 protein [Candidatus Schekmanbacteria bacterium]|nr:glycosyltransferase family 39 protein [Candidatus Schekmanbacteria bacterium]